MNRDMENPWFPPIRHPGALVVGDINHDVIAKPEGPIIQGSDRRAIIRRLPGGSGTNQACWLARLGKAQGIQVRLAGRIGAEDSNFFERFFDDHEVEAHLALDFERQTGVLVSIVDKDGERSFLTDRGANTDLNNEDLPTSLLNEVGLLQISAYSLFSETSSAAVRRLIADAGAVKLPVTLDPASASFLEEIGADTFLSWTEGVTMIFPNQDEAEILTGAARPQDQLNRLLEIYPIVALKRGAEGAFFAQRDREERIHVPAPLVDCIDTTGAGDIFLASFVSKIFNRKSALDCLTQAVRQASDQIRSMGAVSADRNQTS